VELYSAALAPEPAAEEEEALEEVTLHAGAGLTAEPAVSAVARADSALSSTEPYCEGGGEV
jgi:hypothetical protein